MMDTVDNTTEQVFPEEKDYTRPTFQRKAGELGIFIDVYDAIPNDKDKFGSRQFFLMDMVDNFLVELKRGDLFKIKGFFTKRKLLSDITLEYFTLGILLVVHTNSLRGLQNILHNYKNNKLEKAFIECFVTKQIERKLDVTKLKLKIKLFDDEIEKATNEWESKMLPVRFEIEQSEKDLRMITYIRRYQQGKLSEWIIKLKDDEFKYDSTGAEFLVYLKQHSQDKLRVIKNLKEVEALAKQYSTIPEAVKQWNLFKHYLEMISDFQTLSRELEVNICFPLEEIRAGCESEKQIEVRQRMCKSIVDLKNALRDTTPFSLMSEAWHHKIPRTERPYFEGMLSVIPAAMVIVIDVDQAIDEYFQLGNFVQKMMDLKLY